MDSLHFCYWLQGYMEISGEVELNATQKQVIKDHLQLVFNKVTPNRPTVDVTAATKKLEDLYKYPRWDDVTFLCDSALPSSDGKYTLNQSIYTKKEPVVYYSPEGSC